MTFSITIPHTYILTGRFVEAMTGRCHLSTLKYVYLFFSSSPVPINLISPPSSPTPFFRPRLTPATSALILEKVIEYLYYNLKHRDAKDVPDMEIPADMCLELLLAADYLDV